MQKYNIIQQICLGIVKISCNWDHNICDYKLVLRNNKV